MTAVDWGPRIAPVRMWVLPSGPPRVYRHCYCWHRRWRSAPRTKSDGMYVDCTHCGIRWVW